MHLPPLLLRTFVLYTTFTLLTFWLLNGLVLIIFLTTPQSPSTTAAAEFLNGDLMFFVSSAVEALLVLVTSISRVRLDYWMIQNTMQKYSAVPQTPAIQYAMKSQ